MSYKSVQHHCREIFRIIADPSRSLGEVEMSKYALRGQHFMDDKELDRYMAGVAKGIRTRAMKLREKGQHDEAGMLLQRLEEALGTVSRQRARPQPITA